MRISKELMAMDDWLERDEVVLHQHQYSWRAGATIVATTVWVVGQGKVFMCVCTVVAN